MEGEQVQPEQVSADMCQSQEQVQVRGGLQVQVLAEELVEQVAGTGLEEALGPDGGALLVQASLACGLRSQQRALSHGGRAGLRRAAPSCAELLASSVAELGDLVGGEVTWAPLGPEQELLLAVGEPGGPLKGEG